MADQNPIPEALWKAQEKLMNLEQAIGEMCKTFEKETGLTIVSPDGISLKYSGRDILGATVRVELPFGK